MAACGNVRCCCTVAQSISKSNLVQKQPWILNPKDQFFTGRETHYWGNHTNPGIILCKSLEIGHFNHQRPVNLTTQPDRAILMLKLCLFLQTKHPKNINEHFKRMKVIQREVVFSS